MTFGAVVLLVDVVAFLWLAHYLVRSVIRSRKNEKEPR